MPALWSGPLPDLRDASQRAGFQEALAQDCRDIFGEPGPAELKSWTESIPAVCRALVDDAFDDLQAVIELQMPVGAERADLLLLGGQPSHPRGYILELKQWSSAELDPERCEVDVPGWSMHQHPIIQVLNYRGKLSLFNARGADYDFGVGAFLHNLGLQALDNLRQECVEAIPFPVPLFGKRDEERLASAIAEHLLPADVGADEHDRLVNSPYQQSARLFEVLAEYADEIAERAFGALAGAGIGLTEEQELIVENALASTRRGKEEVFLIEGGPGSGKTLVAVSLFLRAIKEGMRCALAIRNRTLRAILKRCFDASFPGASGALMYFESFGKGIGDPQFQGTFDLVICDEAQRMRSPSMPVVFARAPVSVVFFDETQRLNPREEGTRAAFTKASGQTRREVIRGDLPAAMRCRGGQPYHDWVDRLISQPPATGSEAEGWRKRYLFEACSSIEDLLSRLQEIKRSDGAPRVGLVASFTESRAHGPTGSSG